MEFNCIPIRYNLDNDSIDAVLDGKLTPYIPFKFTPPKRACIRREHYARIRELAAKIRDTNSAFREVYPRAIGDLCRICAITGKIDSWLMKLVCNLKAGHSLEEALTKVEA